MSHVLSESCVLTSCPHRGLITHLLMVLRARVKGTRELKGLPLASCFFLLQLSLTDSSLLSVGSPAIPD